MTGLTWRRPNPTGAETTSRPLGRVRSACAGTFGLLDIGENATRAFQIAGADVGQRDRPRGPLQQPRAEAILQRRNQPGHAGGRQPELARRRGKTLEVGHRDKGLHGVDAIHNIISYAATMKCQYDGLFKY